MRDSELIIEPPISGYEAPGEQVAALSEKYRALPGRVVVLMDPPRRTFGLLHLPDDLQNTVRPEAGTVVSGGGVLATGTRVVVRPYGGMWRDEEDSIQLRLYGVNDAWHEDVLMKWVDDAWTPISTWMLVRRDLATSRDGLVLTDLAARPYRQTATVVRGEGFSTGDRVVLTSDPNAFLKIRWADEELALVQETVRDEEGEQVRQVWALIEEEEAA
jgi:hypothetical protein